MRHHELMTRPTAVTPPAPRTDAAPIDWANVAVETTVMLRLQEAPVAAGGQAGQNEAPAEG
jgi:hypothetical protein